MKTGHENYRTQTATSNSKKQRKHTHIHIQKNKTALEQKFHQHSLIKMIQ